MSVEISLEGFDLDGLAKAIELEAFRERVTRAVRKEIVVILKDAWVRTPKKTGTLRESIYQGDVEYDDQVLEIEIGYTADYAPRVHEDLAMVHRNGEAKFLEHALNAALPGFVARVAERIKSKR